jgi:hypothetical protein
VSLAGDEEETAYEQSFDGRVVRLGKGFVLHGCPWIKGGEWDEVEALWDADDDPDALDPTSLLKRYLKEQSVKFQAWIEEGFESAVCLTLPISQFFKILTTPCSSLKGCGSCDRMQWRQSNETGTRSSIFQV